MRLGDHPTTVHIRQVQLDKTQQSNHLPPARAMFDLSYRLAEAEESWLEEFRTRLEQPSGEDNPHSFYPTCHTSYNEGRLRQRTAHYQVIGPAPHREKKASQ